jgi:hypothetical protein
VTPPKASPDPRAATPRRVDPEARRRIAEAAQIWVITCLSGVVVITALALWHLVRRGRMLRDQLRPPRDTRLPEIDSDRNNP